MKYVCSVQWPSQTNQHTHHLSCLFCVWWQCCGAPWLPASTVCCSELQLWCGAGGLFNFSADWIERSYALTIFLHRSLSTISGPGTSVVLLASVSFNGAHNEVNGRCSSFCAYFISLSTFQVHPLCFS